MHVVHVWDGSGTPELLNAAVADGKKLFLWREVLVLIDLRAKGHNQIISEGWQVASNHFLTGLDDTLQSALQCIIHHQMVMEDVKMDSKMAVQNCTIIVIGM